MLGWAAVASFVVSIVVVRILLTRFAGLALDRPNERSLHERPVPRTGGIGVLAGAAAAFGFGAGELWLSFVLALALTVVSFLDDVSGLPTAMRLGSHLAASAVLAWYLLSPMSLPALVVLALAVAWITNVYNFMDGSDGIAGGMAVLGFGTYALAAYLAQDAPLAVLSTALASAAAAFLVYNIHPARIFLGDVGSIPLGFLAGGLGVLGWRDDAWPLWFPVLVFGPFIADATITLLRRLARGEKVWQAHRDHYYQRIVRMGFGHRGAAAIGYAAMLVCAAAALLGRAQPPVLQMLAFGAGSAALGMLALWVDLRWARQQRDRAAR
jgi:UDP-N-acetylmuramyl pentapeptide phosphotransferase/UDP-N-acetylglucosamine-1-phosphate transferase